MQNPTTLAAAVPPHVTMQILIDRHGAWTAFVAFVKALRGTVGTTARIAEMPDHLRRDIGLTERGEPPPALRDLWM